MSQDVSEKIESPLPEARVDLWLWAVRLFKTRAAATQACRNHRVLMLGQPVKPSRLVRPGDVIDLLPPGPDRLVRVLDVLVKRVGAKRVPDYLADETPAERRIAAEARREALRLDPGLVRDDGSGRPTKRDRRQMDKLMEDSAAKEAGLRDFVKKGLRREPGGS